MSDLDENVAVPVDGGLWRGPSEAEWLKRISNPSTPVGESIPWIKKAMTPDFPEAPFERLDIANA